MTLGTKRPSGAILLTALGEQFCDGSVFVALEPGPPVTERFPPARTISREIVVGRAVNTFAQFALRVWNRRRTTMTGSPIENSLHVSDLEQEIVSFRVPICIESVPNAQTCRTLVLTTRAGWTSIPTCSIAQRSYGWSEPRRASALISPGARKNLTRREV